MFPIFLIGVLLGVLLRIITLMYKQQTGHYCCAYKDEKKEDKDLDGEMICNDCLLIFGLRNITEAQVAQSMFINYQH